MRGRTKHTAAEVSNGLEFRVKSLCEAGMMTGSFMTGTCGAWRMSSAAHKTETPRKFDRVGSWYHLLPRTLRLANLTAQLRIRRISRFQVALPLSGQFLVTLLSELSHQTTRLSDTPLLHRRLDLADLQTRSNQWLSNPNPGNLHFQAPQARPPSSI